jgi:SNF2 family DNA or RNA helicase
MPPGSAFRRQIALWKPGLAPALKLRYRRKGERVYVRIETDVPDERRVWRTLEMLGAPVEVDKDPRALSWARFVKEAAFPKLQKAAQLMRATLDPETGEAPVVAGKVGAAYAQVRPVDVAALVKLAREDPAHALGALRAGRTELAVWMKDRAEFAAESKRDLKALDEAIDSLKVKSREAEREREKEEARQLSIALKGVSADDVWRAKAELESLKRKADEAALKERVLADVPERIAHFRGKLRPYQQEGVQFLVGRNLRAILADEMGLGKTVMAIAAVCQTNARALVVGPANVLYNWADEIERFTDEVPLIYHERKHFGNPRSRFLVTTYDALRSLALDDEQVTSRDVLILDEAHYVRNPDTQRAQLVKSLPQKKRVLLTGTPLVNTLDDYYELLEQVDPERFSSRTDFRRDWAVDASLFNKYAPVRLLAAEFLHKATRDVLLRRRKQEVLTELPDRVISVSKHELGPAAERAYRQLETKALDALREGKSDVAIFAAFHALRHHLAVARVPAILERVQELLATDEAVVVYSHYLEPLEKLQEALGAPVAAMLSGATRPRSEPARPIAPVAAMLTGATAPKRRKLLADTLGRGDGPRVLLAQMEAGGIGLNLTGARYVLFVHLGWTPAVHAQAMDRVHRIGQDRAVFVEFFVTPDTIDERIARILLRKEADQNLVLAEGTDLLNRAELAKLLAEDRAADVAARDAAEPDALLRRLTRD